MRLILVAAMSENRVIGRGGGLPWKLPADLAHFKRTTLDHVLIMGRTTFESLGGVGLPGRSCVVMTRKPSEFASSRAAPALSGAGLTREKVCGALAAESFQAALSVGARIDAERHHKNAIMIVGGAKVYAQALPHAHRLHLTLVHATVEGDTYFPEFEADGSWAITHAERHEADARHEHAYSFRTYERVGPDRAA